MTDVMITISVGEGGREVSVAGVPGGDEGSPPALSAPGAAGNGGGDEAPPSMEVGTGEIGAADLDDGPPPLDLADLDGGAADAAGSSGDGDQSPPVEVLDTPSAATRTDADSEPPDLDPDDEEAPGSPT